MLVHADSELESPQCALLAERNVEIDELARVAELSEILSGGSVQLGWLEGCREGRAIVSEDAVCLWDRRAIRALGMGAANT